MVVRWLILNSKRLDNSDRIECFGNFSLEAVGSLDARLDWLFG